MVIDQKALEHPGFYDYARQISQKDSVCWMLNKKEGKLSGFVFDSDG